MLEADAQLYAGVLRRRDHCVHIRRVNSQGLLTENVLARLRRGDGHLGVQVVGRTDTDGVDIGARQQLAVVGSEKWKGIFGCHALCPLTSDIADTNQARCGQER